MKKVLVILFICFQLHGVKHRKKLFDKQAERRSSRLRDKQVRAAKEKLLLELCKKICVVPVNAALLRRFVLQYGDN